MVASPTDAPATADTFSGRTCDKQHGPRTDIEPKRRYQRGRRGNRARRQLGRLRVGSSGLSPLDSLRCLNPRIEKIRTPARSSAVISAKTPERSPAAHLRENR